MPNELFVSTSQSAHANSRRPWTLVASMAAHAALLFTILAVSVTSVIAGPDVVRHLHVFMASTPPVPPPPPSAHAAPRLDAPVNPALAPVTAPATIGPEINVPPVASGRDIPDGVAIVSSDFPAGLGVAPALPTAPPVKPAEIPHVGGDIRAPTRLVYVPPVYPTIAQTAHIEGDVILEATLDEHGAVRDVKLLRSIPVLDRAAIDAVVKWRYTPTRLNGVAVPVIMTITVHFALR